MVQKLEAKGFRPNSYDRETLEGEFNGVDVMARVVTNGDKVWRIMLFDANTVDERSIQIRFNNLCHQFQNNAKYTFLQDFQIPDDERISYEMSVNKKRYEAVFYQKPVELSDTALLMEKIRPLMTNKFTPEELANPTEEIINEAMVMSYKYITDLLLKKPVWFMISEMYGKYYITMFYDNEYNHANGEDL